MKYSSHNIPRSRWIRMTLASICRLVGYSTDVICFIEHEFVVCNAMNATRLYAYLQFRNKYHYASWVSLTPFPNGLSWLVPSQISNYVVICFPKLRVITWYSEDIQGITMYMYYSYIYWNIVYELPWLSIAWMHFIWMLERTKLLE